MTNRSLSRSHHQSALESQMPCQRARSALRNRFCERSWQLPILSVQSRHKALGWNVMGMQLLGAPSSVLVPYRFHQTQVGSSTVARKDHQISDLKTSAVLLPGTTGHGLRSHGSLLCHARMWIFLTLKSKHVTGSKNRNQDGS